MRYGQSFNCQTRVKMYYYKEIKKVIDIVQLPQSVPCVFIM